MSPSARLTFVLALLTLPSAGCLVMQKDHDAVAARADQAEKQAAAARNEVAAMRADLEAITSSDEADVILARTRPS